LLEENQRIAEKAGTWEILVDLVKSKKSNDMRHYASMVLVNIGQYRGNSQEITVK
jgi:hypothetical protein